MAAAGKHETVACTRCYTLYRQSRSDQRYCSTICCVRDWRARRGYIPRAPAAGKAPLQPRTCEECGSSFVPWRRGLRFCGKACVYARRLKTLSNGKGKRWAAGLVIAPRRLCELCGAVFYAPPVLIRRGGGRFCSNTCRGRHIAMNPTMWPQTQTRRGTGGRRADLGDMYFRSSWEANWARYLNWLRDRGEIVKWEFEVDTFEFPVKRGSKFYTPDFKLTYGDASVVYHEVKGYMDQRSATKIRRMKTHHPKVNLRLIDKAVYTQVASQVAALLPHWEKQGKLYVKR